MNSTIRSRPRFRVSRGTAVVFLWLSLSAAGIGSHAWLSAVVLRVPEDLQTLTGVIRDVRYGHGRYGTATSIRFRLEPRNVDLVYGAPFPSFDQVKECVVDGAVVTLATSTDGNDIWSMTCPGTVFVSPAALLDARRGNGRAGAWIAGGFLLVAGFWMWLLSTRRAA